MALPMVALEVTTMARDFTPMNPTMDILVVMEDMVDLLVMKGNIRPTSLVMLDMMHRVVIRTKSSMEGSIPRVATMFQVGMMVMANTEVKIMAQLTMVEVMTSAVALTTIGVMVPMKEGTANMAEPIALVTKMAKGSL